MNQKKKKKTLFFNTNFQFFHCGQSSCSLDLTLRPQNDYYLIFCLFLFLTVNEKSIGNIPECVTNRWSFHQNIWRMNVNDKWCSFSRRTTTRTHATTVNVQLNRCPSFWLLICACTTDFDAVTYVYCICYGNTACDMCMRNASNAATIETAHIIVRQIHEQNKDFILYCL